MSQLRISQQQSQTDGGAAQRPGWTALRPTLRPELRMETRCQDGSTSVLIEDPVRGKFFIVQLQQFSFIALLDGSRTIEDAIRMMNQSSPASLWTEQEARQTLELLMHYQLLQLDHAAQVTRLLEASAARNKQQRLQWLNPLCVRIRLLHPQPLLEPLGGVARLLYSPWVLLAWCALAVWSLLAISDQWPRFVASSTGILAPEKWWMLLVGWVFLKAIHEFGHALACRRYGVPVREAGVLMLLFAPLAYVDVTAAWRLHSRWQRMIISAGGMYFELTVAMIAALVWAASGQGLVADVSYNLVILASVTTILFNANPLMRFDGYYLASDALGITNLYTKSTQWFTSQWRYLIFGLPRPTEQWPRWQQPAIAVYGVAAWMWRILVSASLLLVASVMFYGGGLVLAVVAGLLWWGLPLLQQIKTTSALIKQHGFKPVRLAGSSVLIIAAVLAAVLVLRSPSTTTAPAIVEFKEAQTLRAADDAFLHRILVRSGETVAEGQLLLELVNPQLQLQLQQLRIEIEQARLVVRQLQSQGRLADQHAELQRLLGLEIELAEKQDLADRLLVRSPIDGTVLYRGLEHRLGSFFRLGEAMAQVVDSSRKEVVLMVRQDQVSTLREHLGESIDVRFATLPPIATELVQVSPRGSMSLIDPAFGAQAGGPLAVLPVSGASPQEASFRLVEPRFTARLSLDGLYAQKVHAGQRGTAYFPATSTSLASHVWLKTWHWIDRQLNKMTGH